MKKVELFEHNERAYRLLQESLKNNKCTTINHATGTGKSFIALKYLYENRDKKYLYLAPTYPILEQLRADCYKIGITPEDINVDTMIYRNLLEMDMKKLYQEYDGIFFDEYQRTGAEETYKRIKQLKLYLQENNDSKKFIGLTATPIRYLDNERNMTQEIFDGNVASSISLSEAMLEELLPVPLYINAKIACRGEFDKISRKVSKLSPSKEKHELERKLENIGQKINNEPQNLQQMISKYIKGKKGKYIIFCDNIKSLEETYRKVDTWFSELGEVKKYKVYSNQTDEENRKKGLKLRNSRDVNQANLDEFNNNNEGFSVLLCVDILNEGVHVNGIDGVFLLRRTTSPIIYFQQIGRALSFSGRDKQIKIFDLVNNFGNHNAIDAVYKEFKEEMQKKIKLHPDKAEQYQSLLNRFKIMDETREILSVLNEASEQVTPEKIIASKINFSINLLRDKMSNDNKLMHLFSDKDSEKAYSTIAKYYRYVDNEQFIQLLDLDLPLPEELSITYEERLKQLEGYNSIREREKAEYDLCIERYIKFVNEHNRKPKLNSNEIEEKNLKKRYLHCISDFSEEQKSRLRICIDNNNIEYESWEKVLLGKKVYGGDIEDIIEIANNYLKNNRILPEFIQTAIRSITFNYNIEQNAELFSILEDSEKLEQEYRKQKEQERLKKLSKIMDILEANVSLNEQELEAIGVVDEISELRPTDRNYIRRKYALIKKEQYKKMVIGTEKSDLITFCRKMRTIKNDEFSNYFSCIEEDKKMCATLNGIIEFMTQNGGKLPDKESNNELERRLANQLEIYIQQGNISENITDLEEDMKSRWYSSEDIIYKVIFEDFKEIDIKLAILKNIEFFNKHGHRALKNSQDENERAIAIEYEKKCINNMSQDKLAILNRIFNSRKNIHKTCAAYINNIKIKEASQGERN